MADAIQYQTMDKFSGINNVDKATRLTPIVADHVYVYPLQQASNVDIDNTYSISSRSGYGDVITGTDIHSLWSDGDTCLYVDGSILYSLSKLYASNSLRTGLTPNSRMSYAALNDRVYYTNYYEIGYIASGVSTLLTDPDRNFKLPLPAGQLIAAYRGCIYVARDSVLYISDPLCDYYDIRIGYRRFKSRITLLAPVDNGIYVGDDHIYWVQGKSPEEFERDDVYSYRAIPYTDLKVVGQNIDDSIKGNVAIWTGENGICLGDNSGTVTNLTESRYTFTSHGRGAAFIRENSNVRHYINSLY